MTTLSAKEAARELGTDARTFRKFMRATTEKDDQPGQGNRWAIDQKELKKLRKQFSEWHAPKVKPADSNGHSPKIKKKVDEVDEDNTEDEVLEEPTAEDLAELEDLEDIDLDFD